MQIRELTITRYRGIEQLKWKPSRGFNCLIGPGDTGKSTILSAIGLLLEPRPALPATEYDYFDRELTNSFEIEAVLAGVQLDSERVPLLRGWRDGRVTAMPETDDEPVLVVAVRGNADLEVTHVIVGPDDETRPFTVTLRRQLLLARIAMGERASAELRLGRGSLLERVVGGGDLRAELAAVLTAASAGMTFPQTTRDGIDRVKERFGEMGLRSDLNLGLLSPIGQSLVGMLNLVAGPDPAHSIPIAFAGLGTRQMALFTLAAELMGTSPLIVADEPEAGLEPYRQRTVIAALRRLADPDGQVIITTHSAAVVASMRDEELWRVATSGEPLQVTGKGAMRVRARNPEALLSRMPLLCEGATEAGFVRVVLNKCAADAKLGSLDALGIGVVAMTGQEYTVDAAVDLLRAGWPVAVFVDNEATGAGRRAQLAATTGCVFGTWTGVRNIEEAAAAWVEWDQLPAIIALAVAHGRQTELELLGQVARAAGESKIDSLDELRARIGEANARNALAVAMDNDWFKDELRAEALATHLIDSGMPAQIDAVLRAFWTRLRASLS